MIKRISTTITGLTAIFFIFSPFVANANVINTGGQTNNSFFYNLAEFMTNPIIIPILLTIGCLGFIMELFTPRLGLPGILGMVSFILFFYGHLVTGISNLNAIIWFAAGIVLILLELVLPGGIIGILGFGAFMASFFLATDQFVHTAISLLIAFTISTLTCLVMIKVYDRKMRFFKKLVLSDSTSTEKGYVSNRNRTELLGVTGIALTDLRPSGTVVVEDERIDVVTEGNFISKGASVKIIKTEGSRIVVREVVNIEKE